MKGRPVIPAGSRPTCVVTTINPPTEAVRELSQLFEDGSFVVVGDTKTPEPWRCGNTTYIGPRGIYLGEYGRRAPKGHYARKNIGYLEAIRRQSTSIYDTDDDNIPNKQWRFHLAQLSPAKFVFSSKSGVSWCNAYKFFHKTPIWPRGIDLGSIREQDTFMAGGGIGGVNCAVHQCLADGSPDVDAIWRLALDRPIKFSNKLVVSLNSGVWCPFNSQATWWFPEAYPLMYLPAYATFRMTDIWRSLVAQRCLWVVGSRVAFYSPAEVVQKRNPHNLQHDFEDEIPGYVNNTKIAEALYGLLLSGDQSANMMTCYEELVRRKFLPCAELKLLTAWLNDIEPYVA